jgi:hypothetical protein
MPDISMCQNDKCKVNKECYRYMAIPSGYQSYANFNENNCVSFWPIEGKRTVDKEKTK